MEAAEAPREDATAAASSSDAAGAGGATQKPIVALVRARLRCLRAAARACGLPRELLACRRRVAPPRAAPAARLRAQRLGAP